MCSELLNIGAQVLIYFAYRLLRLITSEEPQDLWKSVLDTKHVFHFPLQLMLEIFTAKINAYLARYAPDVMCSCKVFLLY